MFPDCGLVIELNASRPMAVFTSPNYPNNYDNLIECFYTIRVSHVTVGLCLSSESKWNVWQIERETAEQEKLAMMFEMIVMIGNPSSPPLPVCLCPYCQSTPYLLQVTWPQTASHWAFPNHDRYYYFGSQFSSLWYYCNPFYSWWDSLCVCD